jgi:SHS family lactate transporter-like MFS transporter
MIKTLLAFTPAQRSAAVASYLGWTLDAFDFFILVFVLKDAARDFGTSLTAIASAITLTLAARPLGALLFGLVADRYGRRPALIADILLFSLFELLTAFAPNLTLFFLLRFAFGIAMGGEWGVGAALAMETVPPRARGLVSGLLQTGYPSGYLLATAAYFLLYPLTGWRGLFIAGALPALLVLYIRRKVEEPPAFARGRTSRPALFPRRADLRTHAGRFAYAVLLMTAFNFLSHGTQDLYPTFLQLQHQFSHEMVSLIAIIYNTGAILGGILFGALSERTGRRRAIMLASVLVLPLIPAWAYGTGAAALAAGAFFMQFAVQGAWGVVPAHLNELSPAKMRGSFPGFAYQLGNLLASINTTLQAAIAEAEGSDYAFALAAVTALAAAVLLILTELGPEASGVKFEAGEAAEEDR